MKALVLSSGSSHGAFQAGVLKALDKVGWKPDLILGTSVGAINGVSYASGMSGEEVADLWMDVSTKDVYLWRPIKEWIRFLSWNYLLDTKPLKNFIQDRLDLDKVYESDKLALVSGLDVKTGKQCLFSSKIDKTVSPLRSCYNVLPLDHDSVMSSAAIPGVFPSINGMWDGAFQQHNPLKPAVKMGADEIVVVHLNVLEKEKSLPKGIVQTALRIVNLASSYHIVQDVNLLKERNSLSGYKNIEVKVICPDSPLDYSRLNFDDTEKKRNAINSGYEKTMVIFNSK